jgi:proteasome lid subunit RPN8/RPN11
MSEIMTQLFIPPAILAAIREQAQCAYPREACGFLLGVFRGGGGHVRQAMHSPNAAAAEKQMQAYTIDPRYWMRAEKQAAAEGLEIIGIYHSHPDQTATISQTDIAALWPNLIYLIVSSGGHRDHPPMAWALDETTGGARLCTLNVVE